MRNIRSVLLCSLFAAAASLTGCASSGSSSASDRRPTYIDDYASGNYAAAYGSASAAAGNKSLSDSERDRAILIAGEAAYAMDNNADAERWLTKITDSQDELVRGKAQANLGLVELDKGNMSQAAGLLTDASMALMGDEAARCAMYAGDAQRAQRKETDAINSYRRAAELVKNDAELRSDITERIAGKGPAPSSAGAKSSTVLAQGKGPFTLQLAAFTSPQKARQHIAKVKTQTSRLALGAPHMVPAYRNGKILYTVRVGSFAAKPDADRAKTSFQGAIVTPVGS